MAILVNEYVFRNTLYLVYTAYNENLWNSVWMIHSATKDFSDVKLLDIEHPRDAYQLHQRYRELLHASLRELDAVEVRLPLIIYSVHLIPEDWYSRRDP